MVKFVPIVTIAMIVTGWTRAIAAQPPLPHNSGVLAMLDGSAALSPGIGKDWRRFGSGLEDDRPPAARVRIVASVEDNHPVVWVDRFGSGLEDDAPVRPLSVFMSSGLELLGSTQSPDSGIRAVRFGSGLEDDRPILSGVRFGSGLEDDAPVHKPNVLNQPGF